jgi:hypothetical protein
LACKGGCKTQIRFVGDATKPDVLQVVASLIASTELLPSDPIVLTLSNPLFAPIATFSLPAGSLAPKGRSFVYRNTSAKQAGGLALVSLTPDRSVLNQFDIRVEAYSTGLEARATVPDMTLSFRSATTPTRRARRGSSCHAAGRPTSPMKLNPTGP